jgi:hypothetical protein
MIATETMNGIFKVSSLRSRLTSRQIFKSVSAGACLFVGFVGGINYSPQIAKKITSLNPLHHQTISYAKIAWLPEVNSFNLAEQNAKKEENLNQIEVPFVPFALEQKTTKHLSVARTHLKRRSASFKQLELAYSRFQTAVKSEAPVNLFFDFQMAAKGLRQDLITGFERMNDKTTQVALVEPRIESVPYLQSSADVVALKPKPVTRPRHKELSALVVAPEVKVAEVTEVTYPKLESESESESKSDPEPVVKTVTVPKLNIQTVDIQNQAVTPASSTELTKIEQKKLSEGLLNLQFENKKVAAIQAVTPYVQAAQARATSRSEVAKEVDPTDIDKETNFVREQEVESDTYGFRNQSKNECSILNTHNFVKPNTETAEGMDTHVCPENKTWISKGWNERGWVKVESADHIPTMTMHPAPNGGSTLLLDANALALLAVKSGVRIARGAGVVIGLVPAGYKIEFVGRGEETQYFELAKKKYFAVVNAEPGPGVIELLSEANQNLSSRVFTPVLEDTITYLDLAAPERRDIGIQVVKNGISNDPEIVGLTVGLSTQQNIQAITQSNGTAILRNVNVVQGYPVFIDVSSKSKDQLSYTYRYEIKSRNTRGYHVVNQIKERSLYKWLKQVKQGLSDQSAMIVGFYNRKILNGFKNLYTTKTEPKGAHFGLEPMNYSILWDGKISATEPLEGDVPRFMSVQVPEGLSQVQLLNEAHQITNAQLIPVSPRVIHVISE